MNKSSTILIVDDSPMALALIAEPLTSSGFIVHTADSGEMALAVIATKAPDLILLDLRMPLMDGFEVCQRLKEQEEPAISPLSS